MTYQSDLSTAWLSNELIGIEDMAAKRQLSAAQILALRLLAVFERGRLDGLSYEDAKTAIMIQLDVE